jgi:hypothetical protein
VKYFFQVIVYLYSVEREVLVLRPRAEPLSGCSFQRGRLAKTAGSADRGLEGGEGRAFRGIWNHAVFVLLT